MSKTKQISRNNISNVNGAQVILAAAGAMFATVVVVNELLSNGSEKSISNGRDNGIEKRTVGEVGNFQQNIAAPENDLSGHNNFHCARIPKEQPSKAETTKLKEQELAKKQERCQQVTKAHYGKRATYHCPGLGGR